MNTFFETTSFATQRFSKSVKLFCVQFSKNLTPTNLIMQWETFIQEFMCNIPVGWTKSLAGGYLCLDIDYTTMQTKNTHKKAHSHETNQTKTQTTTPNKEKPSGDQGKTTKAKRPTACSHTQYSFSILHSKAFTIM